MTADKVKQVLQRLREIIAHKQPWRRVEEPRPAPKRLDERDRKALFYPCTTKSICPHCGINTGPNWRSSPAQFDHLLYVVEDGRDLVEAGRMEKAHRHLGWVQGALWAFGLVSIDELMQMNRPDSEAQL